MTKGNNRARIMTRLDKDLHQKAQAEAKSLGLSLNDFVVLLLKQHFGEVTIVMGRRTDARAVGTK